MKIIAKVESPNYYHISRPVWPDGGIKSCPIFPNIVQKVAKSFWRKILYYLKYPKNLP